ncbi:DUF6174 domain-containing protein [Conexibacter sp. JD483]|uniref:DUF6174 domain-containing protein n=1 Tax=unclassified Conexibacter TaxID=2627773 RepID=UPI002720D0DC|nr:MULTISPECIES: DUF6174 domain-containing protein [unclassified Conexibacter]MDO8186494.1 DUF6174 domain-containing protein [Conexibacter sp. CPCC 205706]MDO8200063.1 DUF6174 domain-containing protein [Conexibacter sp. CPCC 205762]MDR9372289.1 DUF6174 domain-containing protein [Conexibacter sp. JD483]
MTRVRLNITPAAAVRAALAALLLALVTSAPAAAPAGAIPTPPSPPAADPDRQQVDPGIADGDAQRRLDAARERWAAAGIDAYTMRVRIGCFCDRATTTPRTLTVRDGRPARTHGRRTPAALRPYASVPRIYARVQQAIDDRVALLTVRYDRRGLVTSLYVDTSFMIADEEHGITVDRFRRLR